MIKKLSLPPLDEDCFRYVVGVDNSIRRRSEKEVFMYAVMGYCGDDITIQQGTIINDLLYGGGSSPFPGYCKQLAEHYNTKVTFDAEFTSQ